jgi:cyclopropane fatty-acyl-phospholipid synthase-like methyltransferase
MLYRLFFNLMYLLHQTPWDTGISPPELIDFIRSHPAGRALDLGCGTGTNAIMMAQNGWQVMAVDFIQTAIHQANRKARQAGVQVDFHILDVTHLAGISGPFELILDIGCFHSLPRQGKIDYAKNLERLLLPGGTFLMYAFTGRPEDTGPGLDESDLALLARQLSLVKRQEGLDGGRRSSAWFTYQR